MQKAKVNQKEFEIATGDDNSITVDGVPFDWNVEEIAKGYFHILRNSKSYRAEIVDTDVVAKTVSVKINGSLYTVAVKDKFDLLLEKMGMTAAASNKLNTIKAPMPGLIIDLRVREGDVVKQGDTLLILEAMKMENSIKSPGEGVVKAVRVKKRDSVEKGQILIEF